MLTHHSIYQKLPLPEEQEYLLGGETAGRMFKSGNLQEIFLNNCRKNEDIVTICISSGETLRGHIVGFDLHVIILGGENWQTMLYKAGIVSIRPCQNVQYIFKEKKR